MSGLDFLERQFQKKLFQKFEKKNRINALIAKIFADSE